MIENNKKRNIDKKKAYYDKLKIEFVETRLPTL